MKEDRLHLVSEIVEVRFNEEEISAVEGWRQANDFSTREDAVRHLVRLGLLSEIGRIYQESLPD